MSAPIFAPDESKGALGLAVISTVVGLALVAVLLRLYTRICIIKNTGWDDYLAIISFVRHALSMDPKNATY